MKKLFLCVLCLLLLASCGKQPEPTTEIAGDAEAYSTIDPSVEIETAAEPQAKELTCKPLERDGGVYGFEMRFRRTDTIDAMMASADNFYFGVLQRGKTKLVVPTEEIRVLVDVPTDSFVVTLFMPLGESFPAGNATVSFYISPLSDGASKAIFAAQQTVEIS